MDHRTTIISFQVPLFVCPQFLHHYSHYLSTDNFPLDLCDSVSHGCHAIRQLVPLPDRRLLESLVSARLTTKRVRQWQECAHWKLSVAFPAVNHWTCPHYIVTTSSRWDVCFGYLSVCSIKSHQNNNTTFIHHSAQTSEEEMTDRKEEGEPDPAHTGSQQGRIYIFMAPEQRYVVKMWPPVSPTHHELCINSYGLI